MHQHLLVPLDGSPLAEAAIPLATELARRLHLGILLTRVHSPAVIVPSPAEMPIMMLQPEWDEGVRAETRTWLVQRAADLARTTGLHVSPVFCIGNPAEEIASVAARRRVRAIVCSTHGSGGLAPHWLGSVTDALVRHARCPVFALPPGAPARSGELRTLLVLLDGSEVSTAILPQAAWIAGAFQAEVELLSVVAPSSGVGRSLVGIEADERDPLGVDAHAIETKAQLDGIAGDLRGKGIRARSTVEVSRHPTRAILDHISRTNPDAVALASYGRGLSRLLLGSIADKVLRSSGRPTLLFRPRPRPAAKGGIVVNPALEATMTGAGSGTL